MIRSEQYHGPLPHPELLEKYQKVGVLDIGYVFGSVFLSLLVLLVFAATVVFVWKGYVYPSLFFGATGFYGFFRYLGNFLKKESK